MALKKELRSDNTYIISQYTTDNPKLGAKILADGRESLFLDYYFGYTKVISEKTGKEVVKKDRKRDFLKLYLWQAPRTPKERQQNKETLELAKKIRFEREQELLQDVEGYRLKKSREINFLDYFQDYIDKYTKKDYRMVAIALNRLKDFFHDTPEYNKYERSIKPEQITKDLVRDYTEYLKGRSVGEGAHSIYARFKKVIRYAVEHDVILKDPCSGIVIKIDNHTLKKEVLSLEEIKMLKATHYDNENPNIRRAFIFCLYTGLRFCDVKDLTFANVDFSNKLLKFEQNKTKGHSANSGVMMGLNAGLLELIGEPSSPNNRSEVIFPLPSYEMCSKALRRWVKRAGINKHISWHCARHSFATNMLQDNKIDIKSLAATLGHSGLKYTEKYVRAKDSRIQAALDSLWDE